MNDNGNSNANEQIYPCATRSEKRRSFIRNVWSSVEIAFDAPCIVFLIVWKIFKWIVFFICLANLIGDSAKFYRKFNTYPTNINMRVEETPKIKLPAATLCYRNRISAAAFCEMYPDLCERPENVDEYCQKHPKFCPKNISSLVIPKHGYYTNFSREVSQVTQQLLFNRTDDVPFTMTGRRRPPVVSFVQETVDGYVKCFSENLHLYQSRIKNRVRRIDVDTLTGFQIYRYNLNLDDEESFVPWGRPQVFFAIHPPFNPINPVYEGHAIKAGFTYVLDIKLMCKELCRSEFFKQCIGCDLGLTMPFTTDFFCSQRHVGCQNSSQTEKELADVRHTCLMGCTPDCLKLKYPYSFTITENELNLETGLKDDNAEIVVLLKNAEVKILWHEPFFADGEFFSHCGGLLGMYLGISIWALTSLCEKFVRKLATMWRNYRLNKEEEAKDV